MLKLLATYLVLLHFSLAAYEEAIPLPDGRIVGGDEVDILDYPYQVSVEYRNSHRCGGAIIARTWILSAAHCVDGLAVEEFRIRLGTTYRAIGGQLYNVSAIIPHNNYSSSTNDFDIALFQLEEPIALSPSAQIVSLADNEEAIVEGSLARVAGWGLLNEGGSGPTVLHAVEVPVISHPVCRDLYSSYEVTDRMFCAGLFHGGKDACGGDGGGALVSESKVIGIVSWGLGCARPQRPGVYTNVGVLRDWITEQTGI